MHAEATPIDWELLIAAVGQHKAITETQCVTLFMRAALWRSTLISFVLVRGNEQKQKTDHKETFRFVTEERNPQMFINVTRIETVLFPQTLQKDAVSQG